MSQNYSAGVVPNFDPLKIIVITPLVLVSLGVGVGEGLGLGVWLRLDNQVVISRRVIIWQGVVGFCFFIN